MGQVPLELANVMWAFTQMLRGEEVGGQAVGEQSLLVPECR
jgi:hypothetical protein